MGKLLKKTTGEFKIELNHTFKDIKRDLLILDREYTRDKNQGFYKNYKNYKYYCNKCGYTGWMGEYSLLNKIGCACCHGQVIEEGINDIPTTASWMVPFFVGGINEAKKYARCSGTEIIFKCPICNKLSDKKIRIADVYRRHSIACICGDGFSYPEKFMFNFLTQLNVKFKTQLTKNDFQWCDKYKYDFFIPEINCIIETHGSQHYENRNLNSIFYNDRIKEKIAVDNNVNYIIIDCRESNLKFIKNNILRSKLNEIFNINNIEWEQCNESACSNLIKKVCDCWNCKQNLKNIDNICEYFKLSKNTVIRYLIRGNENNWCNYNPRLEKLKHKKVDKQVNINLLNQICELWNNKIPGMLMIDISKKLKISMPTLRKYLKIGKKNNLCDYN